jgi:hypothetical protein
MICDALNSGGGMKKIPLYLRVSTDRQTTDSQAIELRDYCKRRGWTDVAEYCDTGSGAKQWSHMIVPSFPAKLIVPIAGSGSGEEPSGDMSSA